MVISVPVSVLCFLLLPALQPYFDWWIGILLVASIGYMIVTSEAPGWALAIFAISGVLGAFALHYTFLSWHTLAGESAILMPLLTGLFGISVLLVASQGSLPVQHFSGLRIEDKAVIKYSLLGTGAGIAVGWFRAVNSIGKGVLASVIGYDKDRRSISLQPARQILPTHSSALPLFSPCPACATALWLPCGDPAALHGRADGHRGARVMCSVYHYGPAFASAYLLNGFDSRVLNRAVIAFVVLLSVVLTGPFGFFILLLATAVGLVPHLVNIQRMYCMGAIMIPVMIYSFGFAWI